MKVVFKTYLFFIFLLGLLIGCGEKEGPTLNFRFSSDEPFNDSNNVVYILFQVESMETNGQLLDTDKNGTKDSWIFPESCRGENNLPLSKCGFSPSDAPFELSAIPLDFNYIVHVYFRNGSGTILYSGDSSEFLNSKDASQPIIITVVKL